MCYGWFGNFGQNEVVGQRSMSQPDQLWSITLEAHVKFYPVLAD